MIHRPAHRTEMDGLAVEMLEAFDASVVENMAAAQEGVLEAAQGHQSVMVRTPKIGLVFL